VGDLLSGKPGNVRELTESQENVRELSGNVSCQGKLFILFTLGASPVFSNMIFWTQKADPQMLLWLLLFFFFLSVLLKFLRLS